MRQRLWTHRVARAAGGLLLAAGAFLALGTLEGRATWAATKNLRVAYLPIANALQLFVAMDKGFFAQEGITVTAKVQTGGATIAPAMEAGEVDVGFSNILTIITARDRGFDFQFLVNGALNVDPTHSPNSLLVRADSPLRTPKDLEGKRLALNILASINELVLKVAAERLGFDLGKINLQEIPFPNMNPALKNNTTDAIVASEPFVTVAMQGGEARPLIKNFYGVMGPRILIASWFAKKAWIEKNPDLAQGVVRAMNKATEYINAHPEERGQILARHSRVKADLAAKIGWAAFSVDMLRSDVQPMIESAKKFGYIKNAFEASDIVSKTVTMR